MALNALYLVVLTVYLHNICMIAQQDVSSRKKKLQMCSFNLKRVYMFKYGN